MRLRKTECSSLVLLAATTLVVAACSSGGDGYMSRHRRRPIPRPGISAITDKIADQDTVVTFEFGIADRETQPVV